jgi:hypothetical protein
VGRFAEGAASTEVVLDEEHEIVPEPLNHTADIAETTSTEHQRKAGSSKMETLTIRAASQESARGFCAALADFQTELEEAETGAFLVKVTFKGSNREIVAVLRALEENVSQRAEGPAVVGLGAETYTLHPTDRPA